MHSLEEINTTRQEYRLKAFQKFLYLTLAAVFLISAGYFFRPARGPYFREFALVVGSISFIAGLILLSAVMRSRLILDGSRIEFRSALRTYTADRNEIEGLRKISDQYGNWTRICLKENRGAFDVPETFTGNDDLNEWFKRVPDLDECDAAEIPHQIVTQDSLGATEDERLNALEKAKAWGIGLSVVAGFVSFLALVPYAPLHNPSMVLLALLPALGILLVHRYPLFFTIFKRKGDPRIDMGIVIFCPGIGMVMSYQTGSDPAHLVDGFQMIYWVFWVLFCYVAALFRIAWESPSRWGALFGLLIVGGMYSTGLINSANSIPDRSGPLPYRSRVLERYVTHGRHASFHLRLAPWGPIAYSDDVTVPGHIYQAVKVGDQTCLGLHPGFLHAPWYTLTRCPE